MSVKRNFSGQVMVPDNQKALHANEQVGISADTLTAEENFSNRLLEAHRGILQRIMPSAADREVESFKSNLLRIQATSRIEIFQQYKEFQRQSLKDALDSMLINGKTKLRRETAQFFIVQQRELANEVMQIAEDFFIEFEQQLAMADQTKNELIRDKKVQMLQTFIDQFTQSVGLLTERFSDIIKEGV